MGFDILFVVACKITIIWWAKVGKGDVYIKKENPMKKRNRKGTLRVDTPQWNEYIEM